MLAESRLAPSYFGEGVAVAGDRIFQLTWRSGLGFIYDRETLKKNGEFTYRGEGWGLAFDGSRLIMSDGTATLRLLDPRTLAETGRLPVTEGGAPVMNLNELEWAGGEILANVWQTELIARIDPKTGHVTGWLNLSRLRGAAGGDWTRAETANGIAWDPEERRLFVTGKLWPRVFEVKLPTAGAGP